MSVSDVASRESDQNGEPGNDAAPTHRNIGGESRLRRSPPFGESVAIPDAIELVAVDIVDVRNRGVSTLWG